MAQVRGCLTRLVRPSRHLSPHHGKFLNLKICSWVSVCDLPAQRISVGVHNIIPMSHTQHRGLCVKASTAKEKANDTVTDVKAAMDASTSVLQTIKTSTNVQYLLKCNLEAVKDLTSLQNIIISEACFQRLAEVNININLSQDPMFQLISEIIEKNLQKVKDDYLCSVLGSLLKMIRADARLTKCIASHFYMKMGKITDMDQVKRLTTILQNHQDTNLRKSVYNAAVKALERNDRLISDQLTQALESQDGPDSPMIQELLGLVLSNINNLNLRDIHRVLVLLSLKKTFNAPLVKAITNILGKEKILFYTDSQLRDLFFSCSALSIYDQAVLENLTANVFKVFKKGNNMHSKAHQILLSCSRLNWKHFMLVSMLSDQSVGAVLSDWVSENKLVALLHSLAHLNWTTDNELLDVTLAKPQLRALKEKDPKLWLEVVWSLVILRKATADMIQDVLADEYLEKIQMSISDKPEYMKSEVQKKLLNLTGCSVLEFNQKVKPSSYEDWMNQVKKDVPNQSSLGKQVETALKTFEHISLSTNKLLDYGHIADFELQLVQETDGEEEPKKIQKVAVKVLDFKDMLRTEVAPEPNGESVMCIRHLKEMGYHVVVVPYFEWAKQYDVELQQEYLRKEMPDLKKSFY